MNTIWFAFLLASYGKITRDYTKTFKWSTSAFPILAGFEYIVKREICYSGASVEISGTHRAAHICQGERSWRIRPRCCWWANEEQARSQRSYSKPHIGFRRKVRFPEHLKKKKKNFDSCFIVLSSWVKVYISLWLYRSNILRSKSWTSSFILFLFPNDGNVNSTTDYSV